MESVKTNISNPIDEASKFLSPVLSKGQSTSLDKPKTIAGRLKETIPPEYRCCGQLQPENSADPDSDSVLVINYALDLLSRIHVYLPSTSTSTCPGHLFSPIHRKIISALLDLLVLEGIYPSLTPGVGIPLERRAKSLALVSGRFANLGTQRTGPAGGDNLTIYQGAQELETLKKVLVELSAILRDGNDKGEVAETVKERCLVDIVAGLGELGFNEALGAPEERKEWRRKWEALINGIPTPKLLPILMSLIHPQSPFWFSNPVKSVLSTIPIQRPHSVRHILYLFLSSSTGASITTGSQEPEIPLDTLAKASRLLGAVPKSVSPDEWFKIIGGQLLELLFDGGSKYMPPTRVGTDKQREEMIRTTALESMKRASAYIIAEFLGRKGNGIEEIMERMIVNEILKNVDPENWGTLVDNDRDTMKTSMPSTEGVPMKNNKDSSALLEIEKSTGKQATSTKPSRQPPVFIIEESEEHVQELPTKPQIEIQEQRRPALVSEPALFRALQTLALISAIHPTYSIPERLLKPILLPLWNLLNFAKDHKKAQEWYEIPKALLVSCIKTCISTQPSQAQKEKGALETILDRITYIGGESWRLGNGEEGGIEIRRLSWYLNGLGGQDQQRRLSMGQVDMRVEEFMGLLKELESVQGVISGLFLSMLTSWLGCEPEEEDLIKVLSQRKILQQILSLYTTHLAKNPTEVLQLIKFVLDDYVASRLSLQKTRLELKSPSISSLGKIVDQLDTRNARLSDNRDNSKERMKYEYIGEDGSRIEIHKEGWGQDSEDESTERIIITLSLLTSIISSTDAELSQPEERLLQSLTPGLKWLSNAPPSVVDPSISSSATNISAFLSLHTPSAAGASSTKTSMAEKQKETYKTALSYIQDSMPPVKAHGLYLLRELISQRAAVIDIPTTIRLLLNMIKDGESFVYLNVVKCLAALSEKHPRSVITVLVEAYKDDEGKMKLDERLRVGEALLNIIQREGQMILGETARTLGDAMVEIISRRRWRTQVVGEDQYEEGKERKETPALPKTKSREQKDMIEIDLELDEEPLDPDTLQPLTEKQKLIRKHHSDIVSRWSPEPGSYKEDLRVRTSSLSIVSCMIETNPPGVGERIAESVLDISLAVLQLETSPAQGILRRAAVVCLASIVKNWDKLGKRKWIWKRMEEIKRVCGYVRAVDTDGLVREQAGQLRELCEDLTLEVFGGDGS